MIKLCMSIYVDFAFIILNATLYLFAVLLLSLIMFWLFSILVTFVSSLSQQKGFVSLLQLGRPCDQACEQAQQNEFEDLKILNGYRHN
jgi:hypothetical protein